MVEAIIGSLWSEDMDQASEFLWILVNIIIAIDWMQELFQTHVIVIVSWIYFCHLLVTEDNI